MQDVDTVRRSRRLKGREINYVDLLESTEIPHTDNCETRKSERLMDKRVDYSAFLDTPQPVRRNYIIVRRSFRLEAMAEETRNNSRDIQPSVATSNNNISTDNTPRVVPSTIDAPSDDTAFILPTTRESDHKLRAMVLMAERITRNTRAGPTRAGTAEGITRNTRAGPTRAGTAEGITRNTRAGPTRAGTAEGITRNNRVELLTSNDSDSQLLASVLSTERAVTSGSTRMNNI